MSAPIKRRPQGKIDIDTIEDWKKFQTLSRSV
jgi:hypothetical protein